MIRITLRMPDELHDALRVAAGKAGRSLNAEINDRLQLVPQVMLEWVEEKPAQEEKPAKAAVGFAPTAPTSRPVAPEPERGCWDHRGSPKSWCQYCKV